MNHIFLTVLLNVSDFFINYFILTYSDKEFLTRGQHSLIYFSRYLGNSVAKELSQSKGFFMSSFLKGSMGIDHASSTAPSVN